MLACALSHSEDDKQTDKQRVFAKEMEFEREIEIHYKCSYT